MVIGFTDDAVSTGSALFAATHAAFAKQCRPAEESVLRKHCGLLDVDDENVAMPIILGKPPNPPWQSMYKGILSCMI